MEQVDIANTADRRSYFRIDDFTILYYRIVTDDNDGEQLHSDQLAIDKLTLKARFDALTREMKPMCQFVEQEYPKLSRYLAKFDQKLDMLSEVLMNNAIDDLDVVPRKVNISAGGLSYVSDELIVPGSLLELRFILQPENIGIYSHARVVSCRKIDSKDDGKKVYKLAVEFVRMKEEFRDLISRHVMERERVKLRQNSE